MTREEKEKQAQRVANYLATEVEIVKLERMMINLRDSKGHCRIEVGKVGYGNSDEAHWSGLDDELFKLLEQRRLLVLKQQVEL